MSEQAPSPLANDASLHVSASVRAFELFFDAARQLDGVREGGVDALQDLLAKTEQVSQAEIMSALFPAHDEQAGEEADADDQAPESTSV